MSFKKGTEKGGGVSFSFKQLEEDEDEHEDDLKVTGKYDKVSQKPRPLQERSTSNSSITSINSIPGDLKVSEQSDASSTESIVKALLKAHAASPSEVSHSSPIRERAKAKLETSKELWSGFKGRITDKISKKIEEFSGDSSSTTPSPEKEKKLELPVDQSIKETDNLNKVENTTKCKPMDIGVNTVVVLEDAINSVDHRSEFLQTEKKCDDVMPDQIKTENMTTEDSEGMMLNEEHYEREPFEDFSGYPGFSTTTHPKPRSKFKQLITKKREQNTSAVAHMSGLHTTPDEELASSFTEYIENYPPLPLDDLPIPEPLHGESMLTTIGGKLSTSKSTDEASSNSKAKNNFDKVPFESIEFAMSQLNFVDNRPPPWLTLTFVALLLFAYMILPLPSYFSGFVMGSFLATSIMWICSWVLQPPPQQEPFILPPLKNLPPPPVPEMKVGKSDKEHHYKVSLFQINFLKNIKDFCFILILDSSFSLGLLEFVRMLFLG